ncbi:hypothetical protein GCM10027451_49890 [Geodermatophilus aquaeductus]
MAGSLDEKEFSVSYGRSLGAHLKCRKSAADPTGLEKAAYVRAVLDLEDPSKAPSRIKAFNGLAARCADCPDEHRSAARRACGCMRRVARLMMASTKKDPHPHGPP